MEYPQVWEEVELEQVLEEELKLTMEMIMEMKGANLVGEQGETLSLPWPATPTLVARSWC